MVSLNSKSRLFKKGERSKIDGEFKTMHDKTAYDKNKNRGRGNS